MLERIKLTTSLLKLLGEFTVQWDQDAGGAWECLVSGFLIPKKLVTSLEIRISSLNIKIYMVRSPMQGLD